MESAYEQHMGLYYTAWAMDISTNEDECTDELIQRT